jgi:hypothetical protein
MSSKFWYWFFIGLFVAAMAVVAFDVYAACTTHSVWVNGKNTLCTTCCDSNGGNCTTTCTTF